MSDIAFEMAWSQDPVEAPFLGRSLEDISSDGSDYDPFLGMGVTDEILVKGPIKKCRVVTGSHASTPMPQLTREPLDVPSLESNPIPDPMLTASPGRNVASNSPTTARDEACNTPSFRLMAGGVVSLTLQYLHKQGHLGVTQKDLGRMTELCATVRDNAQLIPVVVATVHALVGIPLLRRTLVRWSRKENVQFDVLPKTGKSPGVILRPWEAPTLWSFGVWSVATQLAAKFAGQRRPPIESIFSGRAEGIYRQVEHEWWVVEAVIATLFIIKDSSWFWPLLLASQDP